MALSFTLSPRSRCLVGLLCLLLLSNCKSSGCSTYGSRLPLNGIDIFGLGRSAEPPSSDWEPLEKEFAAVLRTPGGYGSPRNQQVSPGIVYSQFAHSSGDPRYHLRAILLHPKAFKQMQVLFSDQLDHPLYSQAIWQRPEVIGLMSWCFFGRIPAGDMIGKRCTSSGRYCTSGIYHNAEKRTGKDINQRYSIAINHAGQARLFRGGLGPDSGKWYRLSMGGGILLFDQQKSPELYRLAGQSGWLAKYLSAQYNHLDIVRSGQAGDPKRAAPRSAIGILKGGSLVFVNLGEGKYRFNGGATPARMAGLMKALGATQAVMFDGGGAPQILLKNRQGHLLERTYPEITNTSNYQYNYAYLTLKKPE